jgi:hypothetical protein
MRLSVAEQQRSRSFVNESVPSVLRKFFPHSFCNRGFVHFLFSLKTVTDFKVWVLWYDGVHLKLRSIQKGFRNLLTL